MKKSPLKRKSKLRKESKEPIGKLQRKLWVLCKLLTRKIHGNTCYTCGMKDLEGSNWQTGHMISKASCGALLRYDLRNLRPQCSICNLFRGGEGATFVRNMIIREGQEFVDKVFEDRNKIIKAYDHYIMLIEKYKLLLEDLEAVRKT